jgi:hypothetical protein
MEPALEKNIALPYGRKKSPMGNPNKQTHGKEKNMQPSTTPNATQQPGTAAPTIGAIQARQALALDRVLWASDDGLVQVQQRVQTAGRWPQHPMPIVTLLVKPTEGTRVRWVTGDDGVRRLDICLKHVEQVEYLKALNLVDPKVNYAIPHSVPSKPAARKAHFDALNAERWAAKRRKRKG